MILWQEVVIYAIISLYTKPITETIETDALKRLQVETILGSSNKLKILPILIDTTKLAEDLLWRSKVTHMPAKKKAFTLHC